ncbi:hypothetical protein COHA_003413 [Chlorella ohadii]|uniref:Uncharacterized protein n=1 Tax=Chlorella ohadii TaxID=2649997 RepID=A0AAD5H3U6_9CHLO|nr:hypothetical protein COHA_003413 [Chlorella ohadii]
MQALTAPINGPIIVRPSLHRKKSQLGFAKAADRDAAAVAAAAAAVLAVVPPETWLIPAVQALNGTSADAAQQERNTASSPATLAAGSAADLESTTAFAAAVDAAAAKLSLSLDFELTPDEAQWLVLAPALPECPAPVPSPAPAPEQPAITAACCASQQTAAAPAPNTKSPPASPLAALRRGLRRLAGGLRRRLAAAACMARPATLECGGCPGRRLGNASSGASAEWTVTHVNWS